jgi:HEAT repeat protein
MEALCCRRDTAAVTPLIRVLGDTVRRVRLRAVEALGRLADPRAAQALFPVLQHTDSEDRTGAIWALGLTGGSGVAEHIMPALNDSSAGVRWWAAARLGKLQHRPAIMPLTVLLGDSISRFRQVAAWALGRIGDASSAAGLTRAITGRDTVTADAAAQALARLGEPGARILANLLHDTSSAIRRIAARSLASGKLPVADSALLDAGERRDFVVVAEACRFYLGRDDPALDRVLAEVMARHGTWVMWLALKHSGRPILERAAERWFETYPAKLGGNDCGFVHEYTWQGFDFRY